MAYDLDAVRALSEHVAVVGVGDTDYGKDYQAFREAKRDGRTPPLDSYMLSLTAFKRALADSGLQKSDIDGLAVGPYTVLENVGEMLGLQYSWGMEGGGIERQLQSAAMAIQSGFCHTVAVIYGNAQRVDGAQYGGPNWGSQITNYAYYGPWGYTSPGAHYAMIMQRYMDEYGVREEQLATVPITYREHAMLNENAIMRTTLTVEEYMTSRYVCRPFHIYDYCLINDGGVALILTSAERARDLPHTPVLLSGFGRGSDDRGDAQIKNRMIGGVHERLKRSSDDCFAMSRISREEVDHYQTYDGYSIHLPINLEGFGFCKVGEGFDYIQDGRITFGGELPCNTSGGMLSESYMHGWNHQVEAVRQLRHEAGARQVEDVQTSMYCHHGHWGAYSIMWRRGG